MVARRRGQGKLPVRSVHTTGGLSAGCALTNAAVDRLCAKTAWLPFQQRLSSVPDITIPIPFGKVEFGDASEGLCGGMVFCALDHFLAKRPIPAATTPPYNGMLFDSIVRRLLNSFNL